MGIITLKLKLSSFLKNYSFINFVAHSVTLKHVEWTRFLDCFFKLPQIRTSNFRKAVWQHTEGMVGSIIRFVGNLLLFPAVKKF